MICAQGVASGKICEPTHVLISACGHSTNNSEILDIQRVGDAASAVANCHTGLLENCGWIKTSRTTTDIHDQKNVFDVHKNASETRKVEAKLASCLLRLEGQTDQVSCEHDM